MSCPPEYRANCFDEEVDRYHKERYDKHVKRGKLEPIGCSHDAVDCESHAGVLYHDVRIRLLDAGARFAARDQKEEWERNDESGGCKNGQNSERDEFGSHIGNTIRPLSSTVRLGRECSRTWVKYVKYGEGEPKEETREPQNGVEM